MKVYVLIAIRGMQLWLQVTGLLLRSSQIDDGSCGFGAKSGLKAINLFWGLLYFLL